MVLVALERPAKWYGVRSAILGVHPRDFRISYPREDMFPTLPGYIWSGHRTNTRRNNNILTVGSRSNPVSDSFRRIFAFKRKEITKIKPRPIVECNTFE